MNTFIIAAMSVPVALIQPAYADLDSFLSDYKLVEEYSYTWPGDYIAVGLITQPMFTLSGITAYTKELEKKLREEFGYKDAVVTFDTDLVYRIKKLGKEGNERDVLQIIETARKRR